jgi:hypothetical protein
MFAAIARYWNHPRTFCRRKIGIYNHGEMHSGAGKGVLIEAEVWDTCNNCAESDIGMYLLVCLL